MLSPTAKRNISRIIPFGLIWLFFSLVYSMMEKGLLGDLTYYPSTGNAYHFGTSLFITATTSLILGLMIGAVEILYLNTLFTQKRFIKKMACKTAVYLVIIISFLVILTAIYNAVELHAGVFSRTVWDTVWLFFTSIAFWSVETYVAAVIAITLFYTELSDHLGQSIVNNFFTGRYHAPIVEERIFMFLDMKSSTTIAEHIGHVAYFEMLRVYFSDLSDPIVKYSGEIYQYVGDEIIVSWKLRDGLQGNNCIRCFFAMKTAIQQQAEKYTERFGIVPEFKAGLHFGKVTTGEIGVIKKDITFSGDVLNTASRIQGLCNHYRADILISGQLMEKLHLPDPFQILALGEAGLRGRDEKIKLFTIQL